MAAFAVLLRLHVVVRALGQMHVLPPVPESQIVGADSDAGNTKKV